MTPLELSGLFLVVGRLLLGGLFVVGGVRHFFIAPQLVQAMTARGVPAPRLVLYIGSAYQVILGAPLAARTDETDGDHTATRH